MKINFSLQLGEKKTAAKKPASKVSAKLPSAIKPPARPRKKLIIAGVYILLLISFIIFGSSPSHYLGKTYTDTANGFSIRPPKGWKIKHNQDNSLVEFVDPSDSFKKITISIDQTNQSLADYIATIKKVLPQAIPSYSIQNEFDTTIGGKAAHVIDGEAQKNLVWESNRVVVEVNNGDAYSAAASTKLNDWDVSKFQLFSSLKTFQIK